MTNNMSDKVAEISDPTHHTSLMTSLRSFINTESFVDVQFVCQGGHKVFAHKLMLISVSRLLKKLLIENPDSNEMITVHLPDVSSKLLRIVVNFLYIGFMRLNNAEMDQFRTVLGLLDIELFQKNPEQENPDPLSLPSNNNNNNNNNSNNNTSNRVYYTASGSVPVPQNVVNNASIPVASRLCQPQNVPTEYVPIAQTSTHVPVDNGPQYITIRADQIGIPNSRGEVMMSYSTVPVQHGSNSMVVQHNTVGLPATHQTLLQDQNQYSTFTTNVITSPVTATHVTSNAVPSSLVPVNNIATLPVSQVNVQHVAPLPVAAGGQQIVRLVPTPQTQPMVNNNPSFSNTSSETPHPGPTNSQVNNKGSGKRKSSNFVKPTAKISNSSTDIIDLSDDDATDYQKTVPVILNHHRVKSRKTSYSSSSSSLVSSSSSSTMASSSTSFGTSVSSSLQPAANRGTSSALIQSLPKSKRKKDVNDVTPGDSKPRINDVLNRSK